MSWYNRGKYNLLDQSAANSTNNLELIDNANIKVALFQASFTFDATHNVFSELTGELSVTGYTAGGNALASKVITEDDTNNRAEYNAADLLFSSLSAGQNILDIVIYDATGTTTTARQLIGNAAVASTATNGGNITLVWDAEGILQLS